MNGKAILSQRKRDVNTNSKGNDRTNAFWSFRIWLLLQFPIRLDPRNHSSNLTLWQGRLRNWLIWFSMSIWYLSVLVHWEFTEWKRLIGTRCQSPAIWMGRRKRVLGHRDRKTKSGTLANQKSLFKRERMCFNGTTIESRSQQWSL